MGYSSTGMRDIEFEVTLPERLYNCLADAMCKELWWRQYHELTLIVFNFSVRQRLFFVVRLAAFILRAAVGVLL